LNEEFEVGSANNAANFLRVRGSKAQDFDFGDWDGTTAVCEMKWHYLSTDQRI
jgi:hypothetical protein